MNSKEDEEDYKKIEEIVSNILENLTFLQYYPPEQVRWRGNCLFYAILYITVQPVIAIYKNWQQWSFNSRVSAVDNLILSLGILSLSVDVFLMSDRFTTLLNLAISPYGVADSAKKTPDSALKGDTKPQVIKETLLRNTTVEGCRRANVIANVMFYFFTSLTLIPLAGFVSYLLHLKPIDQLTLPFLLYSPFSFSLKITNFPEYTLLTVVEFFYIYCAAVLARSIQILQFLSVNNIVGEMRLFHLNAREMDGLVEDCDDESRKVAGDVFEAVLQSAMGRLVAHHQKIFWKVKQLNHASNIRILFVNSYICLQIVFGIFIFLKGEFILKVKYGLIVITVTMTEYIFSENGQRLQDEGEELRLALYECNWIGKRLWYTRALQILMIRSNHLPKVGLHNVLTLNRNNVTVVIRGAYSYFSLLNKLSS